ncbi:hypothetical protein BMI86_19855 [Thioclava sp. DLFJ5-1]|uniref:O-antigen ligase family protein n=1 Tax=Thioclava sp. DLFJ5-1 TaxID=1915314 RepID=UPI0009D5BE18|nr:O-antigen ligase family protein [Thioclava sp. DLFJ5-1]OOY18645.1 hypothetical protein BMI86_19855 [Thioclava sp. DLFJ5-1]
MIGAGASAIGRTAAAGSREALSGHSSQPVDAPGNEDGLSAAKLPLPVLIMLLSILIPVSFNLGSLALTGLRLVMLVMVVPLLIGLFTRKYGRILWVDWLFLGHFLALTLALAVNNPDRVIQQAGSVGIEFLGGYLMGRAFIRSREDFIALAKALIWSFVLLLPFTLYETKTGTPLIPTLIAKLPGITSVRPVYPDPRFGLERVQAVFDHPIHFGLYASCAFPLAFVAFQNLRSRFWRVVMSGFIVFSGGLALSSGALLALLLQIGLIGWSLTFRKIEWRWWLLVGLFALAYVTIDLLSNRSPIKVFMSYATFSSHTAYWRAIIFDWGMRNVWANPIFGLGLKDWVRPSWMYSGSMDNFWLVMAVRYGIPGFLLVAVGYALGLSQVMRRDFSRDFRLLVCRRAWVFTFVGMSFTLCTVHVWGAMYAFVFFMFGAGMWMIDEQERAPETKAGPADMSAARSRYTRFAAPKERLA